MATAAPTTMPALREVLRSGVGVPAGVLAVLAMIVLPLPPLALDVLFTFSIALSIVIVMAVFYVARPIEFGAFPTVLLLATLLRLALNVASARVVLLNGHTGEQAAGHVIQSFGAFVIGGNFAVGVVVFIILTIINFVVVTKGSGRISEVSARFTLDAMPGKQMAIDADLNSGLITQDEARLGQLQIDTLIVDREARIGDNWRKRYHALTLHNQVQVNHLPYMLFPPNWPAYIPKDKLANWFEAYVESMELNFWTGTEFEGGSYDEKAGRWTVTLRRADGSRRIMHPRHVVLATGVSGIPNVPDIPSLKNFAGTILHSSQYSDGDDWTGKKAMVIGTGNSGHDIAQDLHSSSAAVTLVQRSPTLIVSIEPSAQLVYAPYDEGTLEDNDLIATSMPLAVAWKSHAMVTEQSKKLDKELLDGLERAGFKLDPCEDAPSWQFKYLTRGGGYYFNVGCSDLIIAGEIGLKQFSDIEGFVAEGARMKGGETLAADLIVLATGYRPQEELVRALFGEALAARVGSIWGFGEAQELRNVYTRTSQPGFWLMAGGLPQCRVYSKYLALQIKAIEQGLLPRDAGVPLH